MPSEYVKLKPKTSEFNNNNSLALGTGFSDSTIALNVLRIKRQHNVNKGRSC